MAGSFIFDTVPEPSTFGLMGAGLMGAWALRRRRRA
jgi:PEP-CTERM motif